MSKRVTFVKSVTTTDATPTSVGTIACPTSTAIWLECVIIGSKSAAAPDQVAKYGRTYFGHRVGSGGLTGDQVNNAVGTDFESSAGMDGNLSTSSNDISITVTGLAATTIDWIVTGFYVTSP